MAITLTTNWQAVASSTWAPGTGFSVTFYLDAKYSTQSTVNNNTTIQTRLRSVINSGSGSGYNYSFSCSYANTVSGSGLWTLETETITSGGDTIAHNNDGTKTITLSGSARINGISLNVSFSGDAILPKIDRYATLVSAPDFNDEASPKITFTKNVATGAKVYAGIFNSAGTTAYASYRDISSSVSNGEYTFNLTTNERNAMRNAIPNSNNMQVMFKLYTTISGTNFDGGSLTKTMTIVNANPTMTYTITETNTKVSALLGTSASTIVENVSNLRFNVSPTAYKGSSVLRVICGNRNDISNRKSKETSPYTIDIPVKSENTFMVVTYDTRYNSVQDTNIQKTMITYKPVAINSLTFKRQTETGGIILLSLDATYYQRTFGSTANAPIVKWKMGNGSWTTLTSSQYSIDTTNNKLTVSSLSLGDILNYESEATFTLYIEDKLSSAQNDRFVSIGIPTLELGKDDITVNGQTISTNGSIVKSLNGGMGTAGYMKIGTFTITGPYQNQIITMEVNQRNIHGVIYIRFASDSGTDPAMFTFEKEGDIEAYIQKSATSTWDLYVKKSEAYDNIQIVRFHKGKYMNETIFTWNGNGTTVSSIPAGYIRARGYYNSNYSTSEIKVGVWIDGKPIYRKVVNVGTAPQGSLKQIDNVVSNMDTLVSLRGTAYNAGFNQTYNIPNAHHDMGNYYINAVLVGSNLQVRVGNGFSGGLTKVNVIIEYTKTTD